MSEESKNFTVKLDNERLKRTLEVLEEAVKLGDYRTYANSIDYDWEEGVMRVSDVVEGRRIDVPIEYVPVLARDLLRAYFNVMEQCREKLKKLESGVWRI